jgi:hypothetical protein
MDIVTFIPGDDGALSVDLRAGGQDDFLVSGGMGKANYVFAALDVTLQGFYQLLQDKFYAHGSG